MKNKKRNYIFMTSLICTMLLSPWSVRVHAVSSSTNEEVDNAETVSELNYISEIDKTAIMTFEISADPDEWQAMLDNAEAKEYIPADITINGTTIKNVGIKPKGNSTLSAVVRDEDSDRYSFKIKFNEYVKGQTWMGLNQIVLNNNFSDATSMKEYLSYDVMSYIGVDAPLYSYADITVNDESWGFYLAVEVIDSGYLARTKNGEGELYKPENSKMDIGEGNREGNMGLHIKMDNPDIESQNIRGDGLERENDGTQPNNPPRLEMMDGGANGVSLVYTDDEISSYSAIFDNAETKSNEIDHQRVIEAIKNLNEGTNIEAYVDVEAVLKYLAAHTIVVNLDSYSGIMGHNYYLYENDGQISILPWDYNMAFGGFQSKGETDVVNFPIDTPVSGVNMEERPIISKLLEVPEYLEKYHQYFQEIVDGYFADGKFEQKIDELNALISEYINNDPSAFYTFEEYQMAISELKELGKLRGESVQGQLDGVIPSTIEGQLADSNNLIDASHIDMKALGDMGMGGMLIDFDINTMQQVMEILQTVQDGALTEEQYTQLYDLGLTDEEIEQLLTMPMPMNGGFGGRRDK